MGLIGPAADGPETSGCTLSEESVEGKAPVSLAWEESPHPWLTLSPGGLPADITHSFDQLCVQ